MKTIKKITYMGMGALLLSTASCTSDFEKINTPPTSVTTVDPALLIARVLRDGTFQESGELPDTKFDPGFSIGPVVLLCRYPVISKDPRTASGRSITSCCVIFHKSVKS